MTSKNINILWNFLITMTFTIIHQCVLLATELYSNIKSKMITTTMYLHIKFIINNNYNYWWHSRNITIYLTLSHFHIINSNCIWKGLQYNLLYHICISQNSFKNTLKLWNLKCGCYLLFLTLIFLNINFNFHLQCFILWVQLSSWISFHTLFLATT